MQSNVIDMMWFDDPDNYLIQLVPKDHPILKQTMPKFEGDHKSLRRLAFDMFSLMVSENGVGIAANQVGIPLNMFILRDPNGFAFRDAFVCINPVISAYGDQTVDAREGCLSFPNEFCEIERPLGIIITYEDLKGKTQKKFMFGALARAAQHEADHLSGITMHDVHEKQNALRSAPQGTTT